MENLGINHNFWQGKRVLITGHTGFKGAWLAEWLISLGAKVTGYALQPVSSPNLFMMLDLQKKIHSVIADINDVTELQAVMQNSKPDIVFHLAAQSLVRYSYEHPVETYMTNVQGTVNILEALRLSDTTKVLVNITTDKCYENKESVRGYREEDALGGYDPYSSSKACAELVTAAYRQSYFNPCDYRQHGKAVATARAGNVIGGGDFAKDRLIPDMVTMLAKGKTPIIRYPQAIRPWQHVLEPLSGYLMLAEKLWKNPAEFASAWNFGPEDSDCVSVADIADRICTSWGDAASWQMSGEASPHETTCLKLDNSKSKKLLHWQPRWCLSEALAMTIDWYRGVSAGKDAVELTREQINQYA